jgi:hypothetical protein
MCSTVPGDARPANIDHEKSSPPSIDLGPMEITRRPEVAASAVTTGTELARRRLATHRPTRVIPRPPQTGTPASLLEVYAAITSAIAAGCVAPPRVTLRERGGQRAAELEFPQSNPDGRAAVDSWADEFDADPSETAAVIAIRYGFEPSACRGELASGWGLRVFTHLDLPPMFGSVDRAAGVRREDQPQGAGPAADAGPTPGGCPTDEGAPTTSSPVGLEGGRPGQDHATTTLGGVAGSARDPNRGNCVGPGGMHAPGAARTVDGGEPS